VVIGWMPAASVFLTDPDGHLLEFIAMLPDQPRPEVGIVSYSEWTAGTSSNAGNAIQESSGGDVALSGLYPLNGIMALRRFECSDLR